MYTTDCNFGLICCKVSCIAADSTIVSCRKASYRQGEQLTDTAFMSWVTVMNYDVEQSADQVGMPDMDWDLIPGENRQEVMIAGIPHFTHHLSDAILGYLENTLLMEADVHCYIARGEE